jgi:hypothetical protein
MDDMPLDFTRYLSERLGLSEHETTALLGAWLLTYEPLGEREERPPAAPLATHTAPIELPSAAALSA